jgi:hypothetical protein
VVQTFVCCNRDQSFLLPRDVRAWLPEGHLVSFVLDAAAGVDLREFYAAYRGGGVGRQAYDSALMVALLLMRTRAHTLTRLRITVANQGLRPEVERPDVQDTRREARGLTTLDGGCWLSASAARPRAEAKITRRASLQAAVSSCSTRGQFGS